MARVRLVLVGLLAAALADDTYYPKSQCACDPFTHPSSSTTCEKKDHQCAYTHLNHASHWSLGAWSGHKAHTCTGSTTHHSIVVKHSDSCVHCPPRQHRCLMTGTASCQCCDCASNARETGCQIGPIVKGLLAYSGPAGGFSNAAKAGAEQRSERCLRHPNTDVEQCRRKCVDNAVCEAIAMEGTTCTVALSGCFNRGCVVAPQGNGIFGKDGCYHPLSTHPLVPGSLIVQADAADSGAFVQEFTCRTSHWSHKGSGAAALSRGDELDALQKRGEHVQQQPSRDVQADLYVGVLPATGCAKRCVTGQPCGKACISRDHTCHLDVRTMETGAWTACSAEVYDRLTAIKLRESGERKSCIKKTSGELAWRRAGDRSGCISHKHKTYKQCAEICRFTKGCEAINYRRDTMHCTVALATCFAPLCAGGCYHQGYRFAFGSDIAQETGAPVEVGDARGCGYGFDGAPTAPASVAESECWAYATTCPKHPNVGFNGAWMRDHWAEDNGGAGELTKCLKRAQDHYNWCGLADSATGGRVQVRHIAADGSTTTDEVVDCKVGHTLSIQTGMCAPKGCWVHREKCPKHPHATDNTWRYASWVTDSSEATCLKEGRAQHDWCGMKDGMAAMARYHGDGSATTDAVETVVRCSEGSEPSASGSCRKKGCWMIVNGGCPNHTNQKVGTQYQDKWGMDNIAAGTDPLKCKQRAFGMFNWCGMSGTQSVVTTYYGPDGTIEPTMFTADVSTQQ